MAQKQKLLTQAISETKEKLDALKLAGQQANEALAKGEMSYLVLFISHDFSPLTTKFL